MMGLVLTAGGARGAYQAGVLKRMGEIPRLKNKPSPFSIVTGASAGAISGAWIAAGSSDFNTCCDSLAQLWAQLQIHQVFRTDFQSVWNQSMGWVRDLTLGGRYGKNKAQSFLDFSPLRKHLETHIPFKNIQSSIDQNHLYAVALSATSYYSGSSFTFIQGRQGHPLWQKSRRVSIATELNVDHVWASCAIPVIFQPVLIELPIGNYYFGDGALRLTHPCSPAIRLGASKVFAIGIRSQKAAQERAKTELLSTPHPKPQMKAPSLSQIFGVTLNSIFLDHLDTDLDHLKRMNDLLISYGIGIHEVSQTKEPMKIVKPLAIYPSIDLAQVAETFHHKSPKFLRHFMDGLGHSKTQSADLMSYLLFDSSYTQALIEIGYQDASEKLPEIEEFLADSSTYPDR